MTMEERIKATRIALYEAFPADPTGFTPDEARYVLEAAFPELFSSPPTHWIAPMKPTRRMRIAARWKSYWRSVGLSHDRAINAGHGKAGGKVDFGREFELMRDAYLKGQS